MYEPPFPYPRLPYKRAESVLERRRQSLEYSDHQFIKISGGSVSISAEIVSSSATKKLPSATGSPTSVSVAKRSQPISSNLNKAQAIIHQETTIVRQEPQLNGMSDSSAGATAAVEREEDDSYKGKIRYYNKHLDSTRIL
ncbi:unnamed protein product [Onchocerca ochengi]|uniref:Uncharacterized protein n=1 Tax=Onchocerca ochengi TaxID=42157 RepID=A0A182EDX8_ONCOC|nr:unnamed protein product [Onchocerca ochengi]